MKLLSHSSPDETKKKKSSKDAEEKEVKPKRVSKEEREKSGRYWGFILLLLTVIGATILHFLKG